MFLITVPSMLKKEDENKTAGKTCVIARLSLQVKKKNRRIIMGKYIEN